MTDHDNAAVKVPDEPLPCVAMPLGQCSVGWSGCRYLTHVHHLVLSVIPDPSHGNHNDFKMAVQYCGDLHFTVLFTTMVCNHMFGPWLGAAFWGQLHEAAKESGCAGLG